MAGLREKLVLSFYWTRLSALIRKNSLSQVLSSILCSILSWTGLLHQIVELKGRSSTEDHPVALPFCKRPDPKCRLLLQDRWLQGAPRAANGCQTRPLLLPVQHRLPGRRREDHWRLGKRCKFLMFSFCQMYKRTWFIK